MAQKVIVWMRDLYSCCSSPGGHLSVNARREAVDLPRANRELTCWAGNCEAAAFGGLTLK